MLDKLVEKRSMLIGLLVKQAVAFLITKLPFLSFGPLGWIVSKFLSIYLDKAFVAAVKFIEVEWSEAEKRSLAEKVDGLFADYDKEPDPVKKEEIENRIVENARELIKVKKKKSITT